MSKITVIGTGYVGLVTGACFADLGNTVTCLDINQERIDGLKKGIMPIYEPGLEEIVIRAYRGKRLFFSTSYEESLKAAEFVFIAVGTPSGEDGKADMRYVESAIIEISKTIDHSFIIVDKSTVPVGTGDWVEETIQKRCTEKGIEFSIVSNPEFLREGSAIGDFMHPDRVVLGSKSRKASEKIAELYAPLHCPILITDIRSAEMIKYASNSFLAAKISFINEMANICDDLGADIIDVAKGMGLDSRIGPKFLNAGIGWGGSCFPKDVKALAHIAIEHGARPQLLEAVMDINTIQRRNVVEKLETLLGDLSGKKIGVLGLAFKANTDDMRESPSADICKWLIEKGAIVTAYDPEAMKIAAHLLPDVKLCDDPYTVIENVDAMILATEWNEFKQLDFSRIYNSMKQKFVIDGRNLWSPEIMREIGFQYYGIGRGSH